MKITIVNITEHGGNECKISFTSELHPTAQSIFYELTPELVQKLIPGTQIDLHLGLGTVPVPITPEIANRPTQMKKAKPGQTSADGTKKVVSFNA